MRILARAGAWRLRSGVLLRRTPVAAAIAMAIAGGGPSWAAEQQAAGPTELEEITVTGTRIRAVTGMDTPTPVAAISAEELLNIAPSSVTEALVRLPQFYNSATAENFGSASNGFFTSPGGGSLNLRGIGSKRTLTLLQGRRVVPATAFGGPDINMFPDQMLRRVEAVTGGASAAYGTDAVSGVVNYILDTEFEGMRLMAQRGFSSRDDAHNEKYSLALGHGLGMRGHILFSAGYSTQEEVIGYGGRDWYQSCGLMLNPSVPGYVSATNAATYVEGNGGHSAATPRLVPACNLHNTRMTYDGAFTVAGQRYQLLSDGTAIPFYRTIPSSTGSAPAALVNSLVMPGGGGQDLARNDTTLLPASNRKNVFTYLDYDLTDNFQVYAQGMAAWQTLRTFGRTGDFDTFGIPAGFQEFRVQRNNAFLPASIGQIMDGAGVTEIQFLRAGTREDWGRGSWANINKTYSGTLGFNSKVSSGGLFDGWQVEGYLQYGRNRLDAVQEDGIRLDRVYLAADAVFDPATRSIRCNVTVVSGRVPDCVPLNIFGRGNASPAAVDWIKGYDPGLTVTVNPFLGFDGNGAPVYGEPYTYTADEDKHRLLTLKQKIAEISASGPIAEGWAGTISAAIGAHYRKESVSQYVQAPQGNSAADLTYFPVWCPDTVVATNGRCIQQVNRGIRPPGAIGVRGVPPNPYQNIVEMQFSNVPFVFGSFDVKEVFAETLVPLLSGQSWMQNLNLQGAVRWADYAGSGSIWSYKVGLDATFTDEVRVRGTFSHDTRAANIAERFDRTGGFTAPITDRIDPLPAGWNNPTAVTTINGGNPTVEPEKGDTLTAGIVYRPNWLPGFNLSVDWLRVKLKDAIENLPAQRVIDMCYLDNDQTQCQKIIRDPVSNHILFIPQVAENLAQAYHESVDVEMGYARPVRLFGGNERLGMRVFGSSLIESSTTNAQGVKTDSTGSVPLNYYKKKVNANFSYFNGPFTLNLTARYNSGGKLNTAFNRYYESLGGVLYDVADNTIGSSVYWDTRLGYDIPLGTGSVELFANVINLFDRDPPLVLAEGAVGQTGGDYDIIGRRFVLGFNLRF